MSGVAAYTIDENFGPSMFISSSLFADIIAYLLLIIVT
jgi:hypothetical protein